MIPASVEFVLETEFKEDKLSFINTMYQISLYRERLKDLADIKDALDTLYEELYNDVDYQIVYGYVTPEEKDSILHMLNVGIEISRDLHFKSLEKLQRMKNLIH